MKQKSLISYNELCEFVERGYITGVDPKDINGTSIDVHLGQKVQFECYPESNPTISLRDKEQLFMQEVDITNSYFDLRPKAFILASTTEKFFLPNDISCEFKLNSSGARVGLENSLATWCDPRWHDSVLTLELTNFCNWHTIRLHHNVRIGQMIFWRSEPVPEDKSYAVRGRYNGDHATQQVKEK
jgi:dCTP deaminase